VTFKGIRDGGPVVFQGMRSLNEIRREIDEATEQRRVLWDDLANGLNPEKSAAAAALSRRIEALWNEARVARAQIRFGPSEEIITRARAHDRLDREARRLRQAA
jgi:hypothetical protein